MMPVCIFTCLFVFRFQLCYLIDAYLSPYHILDEPTEADGSNDRCIVMAVFLHYFFLSQFTWMMTQVGYIWQDKLVIAVAPLCIG